MGEAGSEWRMTYPLLLLSLPSPIILPYSQAPSPFPFFTPSLPLPLPRPLTPFLLFSSSHKKNTFSEIITERSWCVIWKKQDPDKWMVFSYLLLTSNPCRPCTMNRQYALLFQLAQQSTETIKKRVYSKLEIRLVICLLQASPSNQFSSLKHSWHGYQITCGSALQDRHNDPFLILPYPSPLFFSLTLY